MRRLRCLVHASQCFRDVAEAAVRAAAKLNELVDSTPQRVALEASKHLLAIGGIKLPSDAVSVNVGVAVAGWVIDLTERKKD